MLKGREGRPGGWNRKSKERSGTKRNQKDDHIGPHRPVKTFGLYPKNNGEPLKGFQQGVTGLDLLSPWLIVPFI